MEENLRLKNEINQLKAEKLEESMYHKQENAKLQEVLAGLEYSNGRMEEQIREFATYKQE